MGPGGQLSPLRPSLIRRSFRGLGRTFRGNLKYYNLGNLRRSFRKNAYLKLDLGPIFKFSCFNVANLDKKKQHFSFNVGYCRLIMVDIWLKFSCEILSKKSTFIQRWFNVAILTKTNVEAST